jgi:hypothetical protein
VTAASALGVEGVDGAALKGGDGVFHKAAFVQRVSVDHHLHIHVVGDTQTAIDGGGCSAPVLMQLQGASTGLDLGYQLGGMGGVALTRKT